MSSLNEMQSQMATSISSNIKNNPWKDGKDYINAITLCLGKTLVNSEKIVNKEDDEVEVEDQNLDEFEYKVKTEKRSKLVANSEKIPHSELVQKNVPSSLRLEDNQQRGEEEFVKYPEICQILIRDYV